MCGRVRLSDDYSEIKIQLKFPQQLDPPNFGPNWNGAPTQSFPIGRYHAETGARRIDMMRWGLVPFWAKDMKSSYATFNARVEAVATLPTFRDPYKQGRRCLVPVNNFYEWKTLGPKEKQPYAIGRADGQLLVMAGLWDRWKSPDGEIVRSFTIITCPPNPFMQTLHTRMPVILPPEAWSAWLGETATTPAEAKALLVPYPNDDLIAWAVDRRVGNVRNNDATLIDPIAA